MTKSEWRLFVPFEDVLRVDPKAAAMWGLFQDSQENVRAVDKRTDVYIKADADLGVKRRGGGGLEFKYLKKRQQLGTGAVPGTAEAFKKVRLEEESTPAHVIEFLRKEDKLSAEVEASLSDPVEMEVRKSVRRKGVKIGEEQLRVEVHVGCKTMSERHPKRWMTFCVEGSADDIMAFLGSEEGQMLVKLVSHEKALQVGFPEFVRLLSS